MFEIKGKYNFAKVFTNKIEEGAAEQIKLLCDMPFAKNEKIRIMPDVHAGAGCTIGTTMTITDKIVPNLVGVDIGCGMETVKLQNKNIDLEKLDGHIYSHIPSGMNIRKKLHELSGEIDLLALRCHDMINEERALLSIGTLGGGNHFIEVNRDSNGALYIVVHSGSRHLGNEVALLYQELGYKAMCRKRKSLLNDYKSSNKTNDLEDMDKEKYDEASVPKQLAFVEGELFDDYIHDMKIIQHFAVLNRRAMIDVIIRGLALDVEEQFTTIHNYIDTEAMILRKGAISAKKDEKVLIPINMRDGSLICVGKGNEDWNYSAPHGAGRLFSRTEAKKKFSLDEFKEQMKDIYTTSVNNGTIDESPMAYKNMSDIVKNITPTADITETIKPIYNFKASG